MQIPHLFSRAVMVGAPLILVSPDADADELKRKHAEMQAALERVRDVAESWFGLSEEERATSADGVERLIHHEPRGTAAPAARSPQATVSKDRMS